MSSKLLPDELWNEIEQLFPAYRPSPDGGRPPKEARRVLTTSVQLKTLWTTTRLGGLIKRYYHDVA